MQVRQGGKLRGFLTPKGGTNRLKVHGLLIPADQIAERLAQMSRDNPGYEFTAQSEG